MRKILTILIIFFLFSCKPSEMPITVEVERIERLGNDDYFTLTVISKEDLIKYCDEEKAVNLYLFCPLTSNDFSSRNISEEPYKINGSLLIGILNTRENVIVDNKGFHYTFSVNFENNDSKIISDAEIIDLVSDKKCLECKLVMAYLFKPISLSKSFCISAQEVIEIINQKK